MRIVIYIGLITLLLFALLGCGGSAWNVVDIPLDANYLFGNGFGESQQLQLAINKATLAARTEIGRQVEVRLNSLQKSFAEEIGSGNDTEISTQYTTATKSVVSAQLMGSEVREQKYRKRGGVYTAMVVIEYPIGEANAAVVAQIKRNQNLYTRFSESEGFKELEQEVEKYEKVKNEQGNIKGVQ